MKKLILVLALLLPIAGSARMFPMELPLKAVCWDNAEEALAYHRDMLDENPVGRGWVHNTRGPTFATVLVNPVKPSWTFLHFHQNTSTGEVIVCSMTGGNVWEILTPGDDEIQL